jgi:hypothetical protein
MANEIISLEIATAVVKGVSNEVLPLLRPKFLMAELVNRDFEAEMAQVGDTLSVPIQPQMTTNNIGEGGTVTLQNPALGSVDVVLNKHQEASFMVPDYTKLLVKPDLMKIYGGSAISALAKAIETDIINNFLYMSFNTAVGAAGSAMTEGTLDLAETSLFNALVPEDGRMFGVFNSTAYGELRQISRFTERRMVGGVGEAIKSGQLNDPIKGIIPFRSQLVPVVAGSPNTVYNLVFHPDAMVFVTRRLPEVPAGMGAVSEFVEDPVSGYTFRIIMSYNPNELGVQMTVDVLYGTSPLRQEFAVQVLR